MSTHDHRPVVKNAYLAIWAICLTCGLPCCRVVTGWEPRPPDGEPVHTEYWRHARKANP